MSRFYKLLHVVRRMFFLVILLGMLNGCSNALNYFKFGGYYQRQDFYNETVFIYSTDDLYSGAGTRMSNHYQKYLKDVVRFARRNPKLHVDVRVYGDDITYGNILELRAESLAQYMWGKGVSYERISYTAFKGKDGFVSSNRYAKGSCYNRRVEFAFRAVDG